MKNGGSAKLPKRRVRGACVWAGARRPSSKSSCSDTRVSLSFLICQIGKKERTNSRMAGANGDSEDLGYLEPVGHWDWAGL